MSPDTGKRILP